MKYLILCSWIIFTYSSCYPPFTCEKWIKNEIVPKEYSGIIKCKIESTYPNALIVITPNDTLSICTNARYKLWDETNIGDSIFKNKGEKLINVYFKSIHKVYEFPCCDW